MRMPTTPYRQSPYQAPASRDDPGTMSTQKATKPRSSISTPKNEQSSASGSTGGNTPESKEEPYQLRQLHKSWDRSNLPKGSVLDRIKVFSGDATRHTGFEPDLSNTGRTNPALRKRREMERQMELERQQEIEEKRRRAASKYGIGRSKKAKNMAATDIQKIARMYFAKNLAAKQREAAANRAKRAKEHEAAKQVQALIRAAMAKKEFAPIKARAEERRAKEQRYARTQAEKEQYDKAATKVQAGMRSALTRMRVCRMVEDMIEGLMRKESDEERRLREAEVEAAALVAARQKQAQDEEERLALASQASAQREADAQDLERQKTEAARQKQLQDEEERTAVAAQANANREATAEELERQKKVQAQEALEAQRLARAQEEEAKKEKLAQERERRRKDMNLFVGPLPWGVALLPDWWMEKVPHKTLYLDSISEEDDGAGFKEWRTGNVAEGVY